MSRMIGFVVVLLTVSCGHGELGDPCWTRDDCGDGLACETQEGCLLPSRCVESPICLLGPSQTVCTCEGVSAPICGAGPYRSRGACE